MVCLGNICRSPTAQGVLEKRVADRGLSQRIWVDSAGTSGWHIGEPPDVRSQKVALQRGYNLSAQRGRQVTVHDFDEFDFILAMDKDNLANLNALRPPHFSGHLGLLLDFSQQSTYCEVPDPYHGGNAGFELVVDLIEDAVDGLLEHILRSGAGR
jgi:protein-tyrosine phosphatase